MNYLHMCTYNRDYGEFFKKYIYFFMGRREGNIISVPKLFILYLSIQIYDNVF